MSCAFMHMGIVVTFVTSHSGRGVVAQPVKGLVVCPERVAVWHSTGEGVLAHSGRGVREDVVCHSGVVELMVISFVPITSLISNIFSFTRCNCI